MKTSELIGRPLDVAVEIALQGGQLRPDYNPRYAPEHSTNWSQGGPIIEREKISIIDVDGYDFWKAEKLDQNAKVVTGYGPTPLIAAMRCVVAATLGDEVDVPDELV